MANIITDNFDRADNLTVGNGWIEINTTAQAEQIISNQLSIEYSGGGNAGVKQNHGTLVLPATFSWKYIPITGTTRQLYLGLYSNGSSGNYGIRFQPGSSGTNNSIVIPGNVSVLTFNGDFSVVEYGWIDLINNGSNIDIKFYLSTTNTKPSTPIASLLNQTFSTTYTNVSVFQDGPASGDVSYFDDFLIEDSSVPTTTNAPFFGCAF